jgi:two-component system, cell cycle response regulator
MRLTRKAFRDLAIFMIGFGVVVGIVFPFFVLVMGVPPQTALTLPFFAACLGAGVVVGAVNYALSRAVVGSRLKALAQAARQIEHNLLQMNAGDTAAVAASTSVRLAVDSDDEIGESARAFNSLTETLAVSLEIQSAVRSFFESLTSALELEVLAGAAAGHFADHAGASAVAVLCDQGEGLRVVAHRGLTDPAAIESNTLAQTVLRTGRSMRVSTPEDICLDGVVSQFRPREALVLPATYKGVPLGVIVLASEEPFTQNERLCADLFSQALGLALNNSFTHERLQKLAALDPLTGVYNRRFGLSRLSEEYERAVRANAPLGVLMIDVDHFKQVNDTYGHSVGDRLLKSVAETARTALRQGDVLIRYGGEEFLAVLPAASGHDLGFVGERIRRAVADTIIREGDKTVRATVSVGGATVLAPNVESPDSLVRLADGAMYKAKQTGRDRVEILN